MVIAQLLEKYSSSPIEKQELYLFLQEIFNKDISFFFAYKDYPVSKDDQNKLEEYINRRIQGEPIQYILGKTEFYGCPLFIEPGVLIPRIDTEVIVDTVIDMALLDDKELSILDLGCGSGCIGIALAKHIKLCSVTLSDVSDVCISLAKKNVKLNSLNDKIEIVKSNLFENLNSKYNYIVSNPPYIPNHEYLCLDKQVLDYEPKLALKAQQDGLEFYYKIAKEAKQHLLPGGRIFFECGYNQAQAVGAILKENCYTDVKFASDTQAFDRVVYARYDV